MTAPGWWEFDCREPRALQSISSERVSSRTRLQEAEPEPESDLTPTQRETLVRAIEEGYNDIPRRVYTS